MRLAQDCVGAWVVGISPPDSFGVVPTPGTHKGPTAPPCHPVPLHIGKPPRHQATARRAWEQECTTCSGTGWGWGWMGPCGCQASRRPSMYGCPKTVGERGPCGEYTQGTTGDHKGPPIRSTPPSPLCS